MTIPLLLRLASAAQAVWCLAALLHLGPAVAGPISFSAQVSGQSDIVVVVVATAVLVVAKVQVVELGRQFVAVELRPLLGLGFVIRKI